GLVMLSFAATYPMLLVSVGLIGMGSSIFHPEASKVAYLAAGSRRGLAQSIFQLGGNAGSASGPLLAALIIAHKSASNIIWFAILPLLAISVLMNVGKWYKRHLKVSGRVTKKREATNHFSKTKITITVAILLVLIFSKYFYLASMTNYYTFYLINKFHVS